MKVAELIEAEKAPKVRPAKTLWFNDYNEWVYDVKHRYPDAEAHEDDEGRIHALDLSGEKCYGFWQKKENKGVTFANPRPRSSVVHPRAKLTKRQ